MKIRTRLQTYASLESIALTDIILNMFIFFFTSFSLIYTFNPARESRITVKLPQAAVKAPEPDRSTLFVTINRSGEVFLNGRIRSLEELTRDLREFIAADPRSPVVVRADRDIAFDRVVKVLEAAKTAGVERLGVAVEERPPTPVI